jgi:hypothetical protein
LAAFAVLDRQLSEELPSEGVLVLNATALVDGKARPEDRLRVEALAALASARRAAGLETAGRTVLAVNAPSDDHHLREKYGLPVVADLSAPEGGPIQRNRLAARVAGKGVSSLKFVTPNPESDIDESEDGFVVVDGRRIEVLVRPLDGRPALCVPVDSYLVTIYTCHASAGFLELPFFSIGGSMDRRISTRNTEGNGPRFELRI